VIFDHAFLKQIKRKYKTLYKKFKKLTIFNIDTNLNFFSIIVM